MSEGPITVVIADDDNDILTLVSIAVKRAGFTVGSAHGDGASAWGSIVETRPQLVVLDVSMPGMTGLEVSAAIRAHETLASTRIVLLSAGAGPEAIARAEGAGVDRYLTKPFSPRELAIQLQEVMS
ncbi:MAG: response regulator [Microbacteriaceae bacterium]